MEFGSYSKDDVIFLLKDISNCILEQNNLEKCIKKQLKENKEVIEIRSFPNYANCNINPYGEFHMGKFKEYYNIPEDKEVILLPNDWRFIFIR